MIDKVTGNRLGADVNPYVIQALIDIRDNVDKLPRNNLEFTEDDYKQLRLSDDYPHKGYAGFALSYGGKWLGGWCRDGAGRRDYVREAYSNALTQSGKLKGVVLKQSKYQELEIPYNSIIYCDPPYQDTTSYKDSFDHEQFWDWCRNMRCSTSWRSRTKSGNTTATSHKIIHTRHIGGAQAPLFCILPLDKWGKHAIIISYR